MKALLTRLAVAMLTLSVVGSTAYAVLFGCGGAATTPTTKDKAPARVSLAHGGGYGKAVFIVRPEESDVNRARREDCYVNVGSTQGMRKVECDAHYVVACDIDLPRDKPFCVLVREIGVDRESAYPKHKRQ